MCVIAIFDNKKRPSEKQLRQMFDANPDGVGLAWQLPADDLVEVKKGLFTWQAVKDALKSIPEDAGTVLFHSRIATSGGVSAGKCHPYIIGEESLGDTEATSGLFGGVMAHNGIISTTLRAGANDSESFLLDYINPIYGADAKGVEAGKYNAIFSRLLGQSGGKIALLFPRSVYLLGGAEWSKWERDGNATVSNTNYKPRSFSNFSRYGAGAGAAWHSSINANATRWDDYEEDELPLYRSKVKKEVTDGK